MYIQLTVLRRETRAKNSHWTAGSRQSFATQHLRVPSPVIGQYTHDSSLNSIRDTGTRTCLDLHRNKMLCFRHDSTMWRTSLIMSRFFEVVLLTMSNTPLFCPPKAECSISNIAQNEFGIVSQPAVSTLCFSAIGFVVGLLHSISR